MKMLSFRINADHTAPINYYLIALLLVLCHFYLKQ